MSFFANSLASLRASALLWRVLRSARAWLGRQEFGMDPSGRADPLSSASSRCARGGAIGPALAPQPQGCPAPSGRPAPSSRLPRYSSARAFCFVRDQRRINISIFPPNISSQYAWYFYCGRERFVRRNENLQRVSS